MQLTGSPQRAVLGFAVLALSLVLAATLFSSHSSAKVFVCVKKGNGAMRMVGKKTRCGKSEVKKSWGTKGPRGKRGQRGAAGAPGAPGAPGPSSYVALGPLTITPASGKVDIYDLGYGVRIQVACVGGKSELTPHVYVTNTAENTYLSAFSAGKTYTSPVLAKMATVGAASSIQVSANFPSKGTGAASSQVFISVLQLSNATDPRVFYATVVPWAEAETTTCKFAGGLTRVAG